MIGYFGGECLLECDSSKGLSLHVFSDKEAMLKIDWKERRRKGKAFALVSELLANGFSIIPSVVRHGYVSWQQYPETASHGSKPSRKFLICEASIAAQRRARGWASGIAQEAASVPATTWEGSEIGFPSRPCVRCRKAPLSSRVTHASHELHTGIAQTVELDKGLSCSVKHRTKDSSRMLLMLSKQQIECQWRAS